MREWAPLLVLFLLCAHGARAEMVPVESNDRIVFENVQFIEGTQGIVTEFEISTPGDYLARLTDFEFPSAFEQLALTVVTSAATLGTISGGGEIEFRADQPGRYFAVVFGVAGGIGDLGLFGVQVSSLAPIPLPGGVVLLASALGALALRRRSV